MDEIKEKELEPIEEKELEPIQEKELEPIEKPGSLIKALMLQGLGISKITPINLTKNISVAAKTGKMFAAGGSGDSLDVYSVDGGIIAKAVASFLPIQIGTPSAEDPIAITGYTEASLFVFGKNLFDKDHVNKISGGYITSGKIAISSGRTLVYIPCAASTKYTVQKVRQVAADRFTIGWTKVKPASGVDVFGPATAPNDGDIGTKTVLSTTTGPDAKYLVCWASWSTNATVLAAEMGSLQMEVGQDATDYSAFVGNTYTDDWTDDPGEVFGGSIDFVSGKLISEWNEIASYAGEELPGEWYSSVDGYNESGTPTTGSQVVYKLAEPVEYELDPQAINFNVGENTVFSDVGPVDIIY